MSVTDTVESRKIVQITVNGLLGRFDHSIEFNPTWRLLILHGPNGVGKTHLLELIHAVFSQRYGRLARIPFRSVEFTFDDNCKIEISRNSAEHSPLPLEHPYELRKVHESTAELFLNLTVPAAEPIKHQFTLSLRAEDRRLFSRLEREYPVEQIGYDLWIDHGTGEQLESYEILERYGASHMIEPNFSDMPLEMTEVFEGQNVHLIDTQRLLNPSRRGRRHRRGYGFRQSTVVTYAEDLSRRLGEALASNSRTSQQLDRSFPERLFRDIPTTETEHQLRETYAQQLELRSRLADVAILDSSTDLELPINELADWQRKVLATYLEDAAAKLQTFQPLLDKLELLRDIVNKRFLFKNLHFDREKGFAISDENTDASLDPKLLSSGEQHELILMYDLLMNVKEGALVLIDEPEISLHVAWQKAFLDDLDRVASLTTLRFIIATHSPQIIGGRWDQAVELYNVSSDNV
ncbi:MAG: AAA family ATPase [Acidimicrobiaceae bacterium]|nr:AAA family ATPase [Acidimicrobiia bacterium]MCY4495550.1 AAA family ATPase [Acidimicrobiaceae bacterium]